MIQINKNSQESLVQKIKSIGVYPIDIMITGATGSGKSSTINAISKSYLAKIGKSVEPETMDIKKFELDNLILWDSPGLGYVK
jgi:predicted GTPase